MFCRKSASEFAAVYEQLRARNVGLVAVGSGTPVMAKAFAEEFNFPAPLYVDQKRVLYQTLDLKRGLRFVVTKKTLQTAKQLQNEGFEQGKTGGDILQLGGAFLLSSKEGVLWEHKEQFAGDIANVADLMAVVNA